MASTGLDFTKITPDNGAVRELSRLIFNEVLKAESLGTIFDIHRRVFNGDKAVMVGEYGLLGKAGNGCNPTYNNDKIATAEKTWDVVAWEIAEVLCYADLESTLVKYTLQEGTKIGDLTPNDYLDEVLRPRLELAIMKMYIRLAFFADKNATTTADGGVLKVGVDPTYFNLTNGIWKQLFEIVSAKPNRHVAISANAEETIAAQMNNISAQAVDVLNDVINSAAPALRQAQDQVIYITQSFADGLEAQLLTSYYGSELHWEALFGGIREARYRGIRLRVIPMWDEIIQAYEGTDAAYNLPHRVLYTTESNLALGVNGSEEFASLDTYFDPITRQNYLYATDRMGALVLNDDLVVVGY